MRVLDALAGLIEKIKTVTNSSRSEEFACGDCDRWERCGLKPSEKCVVRAAQIEAEGDRPPKNRYANTY